MNKTKKTLLPLVAVSAAISAFIAMAAEPTETATVPESKPKAAEKGKEAPPAWVVASPETIVYIVVDGYVEGIREPFQCAFDMPAGRIVDHLEAIADNVRLRMKSHPRRDNRGEKKGSKPTLLVASHCYAVSNKPLHSQLTII